MRPAPSREHPVAEHALGEPLRIPFPIVLAHSHEGEQPFANFGNALTVHQHLGRRDPLQ